MSTVKIKRSGTASSTPSSLDHGELAINYADATLFWKDDANVIQSFVFQAYASATHASTHATGGSDALAPSDIGAAPAASPTFTGVITVAAGSAAAPALVFSGDSNTGLAQLGGADTWSVVTGGVERVRVEADGRMSFGAGGSGSGNGIQLNRPLSGSVGVQGLIASQTVLSDVTSGANVFRTFVGTQAASFTLAALSHFRSTANTFGAGSTVTTQIGFQADNTLTGATNNYGFRGDIADGTNRWNFYALGTAPNYFAGNVGIGSGRTSPASALDVNGVITVSATSGSAGSYAPSLTFSGDSNTGFGQVGGQSDSASIFTAGHERVRVDASGRVGIGVTPDTLLHLSTPVETLATAQKITGTSWGGGEQIDVRFARGTSNIASWICTLSASATTGSLGVATGGTERMRVKDTGAVRFVPLSADPASGEAGDVYYNSSTNKLRVYNGTSWVDLH